MARPRRSVAARLLPALTLVAALVAFFALGGPQLLSFENLLNSRSTLAEFTKSNLALALAIYMACYVVVVALSIPGGLLLTIMGGFLFGGWLGGAAAVLSATLGATCLFLIARFALAYMLFLRLTPVFPFWLVNLAPALLGVPLSTFLWTTLAGVIPATFAYALAGAGLDSLISQQKLAFDACLAAGGGAGACRLDLSPASLVTKELALAFGAIGVAALIPVLAKKWRAKRQFAAPQGKPE
jgi:uncharacterized membrane protein YdjX (TVP38/TMEM64 family)